MSEFEYDVDWGALHARVFLQDFCELLQLELAFNRRFWPRSLPDLISHASTTSVVERWDICGSILMLFWSYRPVLYVGGVWRSYLASISRILQLWSPVARQSTTTLVKICVSIPLSLAPWNVLFVQLAFLDLQPESFDLILEGFDAELALLLVILPLLEHTFDFVF